MKPGNLLIAATLWVWGSLSCVATVRYVDLNSAQPAPPYTNWLSAAQTIQDAIDAADPGDHVVVTNGVYKTGGMLFNGSSNRVAITKPLLLSSVNGPDVTLIQGVQVPDTGTVTSGVRCVYLTDGATLVGFTLTNGAGSAGGGVFGDSTNGTAVSNCVVVCNSAYGGGGRGAASVSLYNCVISNNTTGPPVLVGGGAVSCFLSNCTLVGNSAEIGGGAEGSLLIDCAINNNSAWLDSGAAEGCTLLRCGLTNNVSSQEAGATSICTLTNCSIIGNYAPVGGGVWGGNMVVNCLVAFNRADTSGGGADNTATLINCLVLGNYAGQNGGGAGNGCSLYHCTLAGNSSPVGAGAANSFLNNCTLTNNAGDYGGAAADCGLTNCALSGNTATVTGGGAYGGILVNCLLTGNSAGSSGGGAANDPYTPLALMNCTLVGNSATSTCGGVDGGTAENSVVYDNLAPSEANYSPYDSMALTGTLFTNSCTTPLPNAGTGNITDPPLFIDPASGNFRLQTNSPCINAGDNSYVVTTTDLDGRPRVMGGTVDMGAYEFQGDGIGEFTAWLLHYGLPTDGSADYLDPDGDGMINWQEWVCDTNPTNALSVLRILAISNSPSGPALAWQSVNTRNYVVQRSVGFLRPPVFVTIATNLVGQAGTTTYVDTTANDTRPLFYRVGVHP